jgi:hypothetical protein
MVADVCSMRLAKKMRDKHKAIACGPRSLLLPVSMLILFSTWTFGLWFSRRFSLLPRSTDGDGAVRKPSGMFHVAGFLTFDL